MEWEGSPSSNLSPVNPSRTGKASGGSACTATPHKQSKMPSTSAQYEYKIFICNAREVKHGSMPSVACTARCTTHKRCNTQPYKTAFQYCSSYINDAKCYATILNNYKPQLRCRLDCIQWCLPSHAQCITQHPVLFMLFNLKFKNPTCWVEHAFHCINSTLRDTQIV